ncbi:hypothetical protein HK098_004742 [Nowakowskiella sp. JEL0407]|nr:hypothetical protein HK098_004742 [Nowakowskiella sp. JEL0407]
MMFSSLSITATVTNLVVLILLLANYSVAIQFPLTKSENFQDKSVGEILREDTRLQKFLSLLENSDEGKGFLDDFDREDRKLTLFAPNNEAVDDIKKHLREESQRLGRYFYHPMDHDIDTSKIFPYHITHRDIPNTDHLFNGQLIQTQLRERDLHDQHQFIRVFKLQDQDLYLNMYARILDSAPAKNGAVFIIDRVLNVPENIWKSINSLPTQFSTSVVAAERAGLAKELKNGKGVTFFVPDNDAWKKVGYKTLYYLFSDEGKEDLKKILKYHVATELKYTPEMIQDKNFKLPTLNEDEQLTINVREYRGVGRKDVNYEDEKNAPENWIFSVNDEQAVIQWSDGIAKNGVLQVVNNVQIPDNVKDRLPKSA